MTRSKQKHSSKKKKKKPVTPAPVETNARAVETAGKTKPFVLLIVALAAVAVVFYLIFGTTSGVSKKKLNDLNVILITLDTLRADYISAYHKGKADTPNIDRVADEGVRFERCISQTPLTLPSHTSILSGSYPLFHQIRDNGGFLVPESLEMVSEVVQKKNFSTSAFIASYVLHSKWGINQGFDTYSDDFDLTKFKKVSLGIIQKRADEVLGNAKTWLRNHKQRNGDKKFFTWVHLYDPHTPYDPPSPFKEKYPRRPYRGEVEYLDHQLGLFFDFLKQEGLYDRSLIILTADHGESLGQHGERTHGFFIYETTVHVPLIIRAPFEFPASTVNNVVELIDLAPTILDALGIAVPSSYQGQSLLGLMMGENQRTKTSAYTETYYPRLHFGWSELKALYFDKHWKYILAPKEELYDLSSDKTEGDNLALKKSFQVTQVKSRFQRFIREKSMDARKPGEAKSIDKEDLQKLAALGYLTAVVDTSGKKDLPDPKGKVHVFNNLTRAKEMMSKKQYDEAIEILEKVIEGDPHIVDGILQLGNAYGKKDMVEEALKRYYQVLDRKPDYNAAMINILGSLIRLARLDDGIQEAQRFLKTFPNDHALLNELATLHILKENYPKAMEVLNKSIEVEKINPRAFNKMGGIYIVQKDFQKAGTYIKKAYDINPQLKKIYFHLAQIEEFKGNIPKAIDYYKTELKYFPDDFKSAYNLAEELRKQGQGEEAVKYYHIAMESNPQFNIPYFMVAKYWFDRMERIDEALQLCNKGIELKPVNKYTAFGFYILADIYSFKGDSGKSRSYYLKAEAIKRDLVKANNWK
ncbi:MAG: sulfatase-like hydrolase/transferase [bacterium]|nr:sulfatase-like hydrolase/transferase [bacterium]